MITIAIIITAFFLAFSGILLVPLQLEINSKKERYRVRLFGYLSARLITSRPIWIIRIWVFFVPFTYHPFRSSKKKRKKNNRRKVKPGSSRKKKKMGIQTVKNVIGRLLRSFTIKRLYAEVDTGDFPLNAQLFPLAQVISSGRKQITINFEDKNSIDLLIETRLYKILWITIHTFLIHKKLKSWKLK